MFLCYADESGFNGKKFNPKQPVQTMVAILPNVYNFHRSDSEFTKVFNLINKRVPIAELKGEQIYRGRGSWEHADESKRHAVIEFYLNWISDRNHKFIVSAIDNKIYFDLHKNNGRNPYISAIPYPYLMAGLHIALTVQKLNRKMGNNKGKTILIFDEEKQFRDSLTNLIFQPPEFIDECVEFNEKHEKSRLSQIIDTAFFVKSHHSSMAQVVDVVAYLIRLYLELNDYGFEEKYPGEKDKIKGWIEKVRDKFVALRKVYPNGNKPFVEFLNSVRAKGLEQVVIV
jgi:hypothetical protein